MVAPSSSTHKVVQCQLGEHTFCVDMSSVATVQQAATVQPFPSDDPSIRGVIKTSGDPILVYRLGQLLQQDESSKRGDERHVVVVKEGASRLGLLVDDVSRVFTVDKEWLHEVPPSINDPRYSVFDGIMNLRALSVTRKQEDTHLISVDRTSGKGSAEEAEKSSELDQVEDRFSLRLSPAGLIRAATQDSLREGVLATSLSASQTIKGRPDTTPKFPQLVVYCLNQTGMAGLPTAIGLSISQVLEVLQSRELTKVPLAPACVEGLLGWRGKPIPVIDLNRVLGFVPPEVEPHSRLLVARCGTTGQAIGLRIQGAIRNLALPIQGAAVRLPKQIRGDLVLGAYRTAQEILLVPDLDRVGSGEFGLLDAGQQN